MLEIIRVYLEKGQTDIYAAQHCVRCGTVWGISVAPVHGELKEELLAGIAEAAKTGKEADDG
ncbi:MAG: hypothetical protein GY838_13040 [bacterium]|nr:hypothetical protein [bacterium]